jgi:hypothetical protein
MDNPEKLATWSTQDAEKQNKNTCLHQLISNEIVVPLFEFVSQCKNV